MYYLFRWIKLNKLRFTIFLLLFFIIILSSFILFFMDSSANNLTDKRNVILNGVSETSNVSKDLGWKKYEVLDLDVPEGNLDFYKLKDNTMNILLLGLDSRNDDYIGRSDSILLMSINKNADSIKLLNIPRDSYVNVPGRGYDKINHSFAYGGAELTKATVENLLGVEISNIVVINFKSFENVINILGGVSVNVPFDFTERLTNGDPYEFKEGPAVLNGSQALAYARMRKSDGEGDFGRGKRQQEIIESIFNEFKDVKNAFKLRKFYDEFSQNVVTDLSLSDVLGLLSYAGSINSLDKSQLLGRPAMINGVSYIELSRDSLLLEIDNIHDFLDKDDSY